MHDEEQSLAVQLVFRMSESYNLEFKNFMIVSEASKLTDDEIESNSTTQSVWDMGLMLCLHACVCGCPFLPSWISLAGSAPALPPAPPEHQSAAWMP